MQAPLGAKLGAWTSPVAPLARDAFYEKRTAPGKVLSGTEGTHVHSRCNLRKGSKYTQNKLHTPSPPLLPTTVIFKSLFPSPACPNVYPLTPPTPPCRSGE